MEILNHYSRKLFELPFSNKIWFRHIVSKFNTVYWKIPVHWKFWYIGNFGILVWLNIQYLYTDIDLIPIFLVYWYTEQSYPQPPLDVLTHLLLSETIFSPLPLLTAEISSARVFPSPCAILRETLGQRLAVTSKIFRFHDHWLPIIHLLRNN